MYTMLTTKKKVSILLVAILALILAGCAGDGPTDKEDPPSSDTEAHEDVSPHAEPNKDLGGGETIPETDTDTYLPLTVTPLTAEELRFFNEEFFNTSSEGGSMNYRNQFLTSYYRSPEEIDLYSLFYNGIPDSEGALRTQSITEEEAEFLGLANIDCDIFKLPEDRMDAFFMQYTGRSLRSTQQIGLNQFSYFEKVHSYYSIHGDTNYVPFEAMGGERMGSRVLLYYQSNCLTLLDLGDGLYHFISNLPAEGHPADDTYWYPRAPRDSMEKIATISLSELTPVLPQSVDTDAMAPDTVASDFSGECLTEIQIDGYTVAVHQPDAATVYAALRPTDSTESWQVFAAVDWQSFIKMEPFRVLGYEGVVLSQKVTTDSGESGVLHSYYVFHRDGTPALLLTLPTAWDAPIELDLDGDGSFELLGSTMDSARAYFVRDGQIYGVDLVAALREVWPELTHVGYVSWTTDLFLSLSRYLTVYADMGSLSATRYLFLEDGAISVYKAENGTNDHVAAAMDPHSVPTPILADAKKYAEAAYQQYLLSCSTDEAHKNALPDDWRILKVSPVYDFLQVPEPALSIFFVDWQYHAANPDKEILAGGKYIDEDGWVGGFFYEDDHLPYLVYHRNGQEFTLLTGSISPDCSTNSLCFQADLLALLLDNHLIEPSDLSAKDLHTMLRLSGRRFYERVDFWTAGERAAALTALVERYQTGSPDIRHDFEVALTTDAPRAGQPGYLTYRSLMARAGFVDWLTDMTAWSIPRGSSQFTGSYTGDFLAPELSSLYGEALRQGLLVVKGIDSHQTEPIESEGMQEVLIGEDLSYVYSLRWKKNLPDKGGKSIGTFAIDESYARIYEKGANDSWKLIGVKPGAEPVTYTVWYVADKAKEYPVDQKLAQLAMTDILAGRTADREPIDPFTGKLREGYTDTKLQLAASKGGAVPTLYPIYRDPDGSYCIDGYTSVEAADIVLQTLSLIP